MHAKSNRHNNASSYMLDTRQQSTHRPLPPSMNARKHDQKNTTNLSSYPSPRRPSP